MPDLVFDVLSWIAILTGSGFVLVGGIGLMRLPDVYSRMHGASLIETMGAGMILVGLMFQGGLSLVTVKLALILAFLFFTNPTTTHALSRALVYAEVKPLIADDTEGDGPSKT